MSQSLRAVKDRLHGLILAHAELDPDTGCWVWTRAWDSQGLGVISVDGHLHTVSRVAAWVYRGGFRLLNRSVRVYHRCRTPACCNPEHLRLAAGPGGVNRALARLGRFVRAAG